jgi:thiamine phosphate synthase YjbQ (UPF0047 family)
MPVETHHLAVPRRGNSQVVDLTAAVAGAVAAGSIRNGLVTAFVVGSTAGITTTEYEPGLAEHDLAALLGRLAPEDGRYALAQRAPGDVAR